MNANWPPDWSPDWPLRRGRHPYQVSLLAMTLLSGISGLVAPPSQRSPVIEQAFGANASWLYLSLTVAAVLGLLGGFWPSKTAKSQQIGMQIERAGTPVFAGACLAYSVAVFSSSGLRAVFAGALIAGIALAAAIRTRQLTVDLRTIRAILDAREVRNPGGDDA